jgi:NADH dehydrogenase/NADH:ubiquinone oxidoreductase subunit G
MRLCVKGRYGYDFVHHEERLTEPLVREYLLQGKERPHGDRGALVSGGLEHRPNLTARKIARCARLPFGAGSVRRPPSAKCTQR